MSDVSGYLMVSAKSLCRDITCELVPGSPPPFLFFIGGRGEPGNEANYWLVGSKFLLFFYHPTDLVENRTVGIIDLLDEECKLPKGSSRHFTETVHHTHRAHFRLSVSTRLGQLFVKRYTLTTYEVE